MKKMNKLVLISIGATTFVGGLGSTGTSVAYAADEAIETKIEVRDIVSNDQFDRGDGTDTIVSVPIEIVDPTPIDPTPVDPTPIDPTPIDPTPIDPTPIDPTPIDPTPIDPTPVDPTPIDPTPIDPTPVDPTPVDRTPSNPTISNQAQSTVQNEQGAQTTKSTLPTTNQQQVSEKAEQETTQMQPEQLIEDEKLPKTGVSAGVLPLSFIVSAAAGIGMIMSQLKTKK